MRSANKRCQIERITCHGDERPEAKPAARGFEDVPLELGPMLGLELAHKAHELTLLLVNMSLPHPIVLLTRRGKASKK